MAPPLSELPLIKVIPDKYTSTPGLILKIPLEPLASIITLLCKADMIVMSLSITITPSPSANS